MLSQFIILCCFYKGAGFKKALLAIVVTYHIIVVEGILFCVIALACRMGLSPLVANAQWRGIISGIMFLTAALSLGFAVKHKWWNKLRFLSDDEAVNKRLLAGCLPLTLLFITMTTIYYMPAMPQLVVWIFLLVCVMSLVGFDIFIQYNMGIHKVLTEKEAEEQKLTELLDEQLANYTLQAEYIDKFRRFRYDYTNRMKGLSYLLDWGIETDVKDYLGTMSQQMDVSVSECQKYSNNRLVDAILQDAAVRCRWNECDFQAMVDIRNNFQLSDLELCTVFSNVLDNALEAMREVPEKRRFIELRSNIKGGWQAVTCRNSYAGTLRKMEDGGYQSTKEDSNGHGYGLKKIIGIVEGKGGIVSIEAEQEAFAIMLCIEISEKKSG